MAKKYQQGAKYEARWQAMLEQAITEPGKMMEAYRAFHNYSLRNQMIAAFQCMERGIAVGPIKAGKAWNKAGRTIKKGESGIYMCYPKRYKKEDANGNESFHVYFDFAKWWFVLAQTEGEDYTETPIKSVWDKEKAYKELEIVEISYESMNGNSQGYAQFPNKIAVNPLAQLPHKTRFHELAHLVLGHVHDLNSGEDLGEDYKKISEAEAEATAMLCLDALELDGAEYCRGYIQNWLKGHVITDNMAKRIINAADKILRAGSPEKEQKEED